VNNWEDIKTLAEQWLKCTQPDGAGCERVPGI
jgi:hypothetical protein